jgi:predicted ATP-grasp superfamily ATP-dependent carboligase
MYDRILAPTDGSEGTRSAIEPLVKIDIDTQELLEQAEQIQKQNQQIAEQLRQYQ